MTILFSIPTTWIAIHRMNVVGTSMDLHVGHFVWIAGILGIVLAHLQPAFTFSFTRWLAPRALLASSVFSPSADCGLGDPRKRP